MSIKKYSYICTNCNGGCRIALNHEEIFYETKTKQYSCECCGESLIFADRSSFDFSKIFKWSLYGVFIAFVSIGIFYAKLAIYPAKLEGVSFQTNTSQVDEKAGVVSIYVSVVKPFSKPTIVEYDVKPDTALESKDYVRVKGQLTFGTTDLTKAIDITIIPDSNVREENEIFHVILTNTKELQQHTVLIKEAGINKDLLDKASLLAKSLSERASRITNGMISIAKIQRFLDEDSLYDEPELKQRVDDLNGNIVRHRDKYIALFKDAEEIDIAVLNMMIDNHLAESKRIGYKVEYKATLIMKEQLNFYIDNRVLLGEKWMMELKEKIADLEFNDSI